MRVRGFETPAPAAGPASGGAALVLSNMLPTSTCGDRRDRSQRLGPSALQRRVCVTGFAGTAVDVSVMLTPARLSAQPTKHIVER